MCVDPSLFFVSKKSIYKYLNIISIYIYISIHIDKFQLAYYCHNTVLLIFLREIQIS